jgi:RNA polymerase sigma-70 factor (ECF subfamily)
VQTAFEQVVITLARQQFAGACSLETWAARVAGHVGLNALRSRRRERRWIDRTSEGTAAPEHPLVRQDSEKALEARSRLDQVRRHLAAMKPEQAETVFLHDALGHDLAEIASVAATQSRLVRGRKELFKRLDREEKASRSRNPS